MEKKIKIWLIERRALKQVVKCFKENYKVDTVWKFKNFLPQRFYVKPFVVIQKHLFRFIWFIGLQMFKSKWLKLVSRKIRVREKFFNFHTAVVNRALFLFKTPRILRWLASMFSEMAWLEFSGPIVLILSF